jgi:DNA-binding IclR family transcriptional regulator
LDKCIYKQKSLLYSSKPVLEALVREGKETSELVILKEGQVIIIDAVESRHPVRVVPRYGINLPAYCTVAGKVVLANSAENEVTFSLAIGKYMKYVLKTNTEFITFENNLREIAEKGFAIEDEELDAEVRSVAAPIFDYTGRAVGSINVSGPITRLSITRIHDELIPLVKRATEEISMRLGYCFELKSNNSVFIRRGFKFEVQHPAVVWRNTSPPRITPHAVI